jgi:hypothetical protein
MPAEEVSVGALTSIFRVSLITDTGARAQVGWTAEPVAPAFSDATLLSGAGVSSVVVDGELAHPAISPRTQAEAKRSSRRDVRGTLIGTEPRGCPHPPPSR